MAGLLPPGGGIAAVAGAFTAGTQQISVRAETFVAVGVVVLAGTVVPARLLAVRLVRREDPTVKRGPLPATAAPSSPP